MQKKNSLDEVMRLVAFQDSSVARPQVQDEITLNYQLNGLAVPDISFNLDFTDLNSIMAASYERYPRIEENEANAARVDFTYALDNEYVSSIEFGIRYSEREYELERGVFRIGGRNGLTETRTRAGQYIEYGLDDEGNLIEVGAVAPFRLTEEDTSVVNFSGELSNIQPFRVVNNVGDVVSRWITDQDITALPRWGVPNGVDANGRTIYRDPTPWSVTDGSQVQEDVLSAYLQANLDMEIGDFPVTGNVGLRVIDTDQSSTGLVQVGEGLGDIVADGFGNTRDDYQRQTQGDDYRHYLPSVNLNFQLSDTDQLRFAYSKVLSRPDLTDMRLSGAFTIQEDTIRNNNGQDVQGNFVDLNAGGNPRLRPFEADQFDLSFERYFAESDGAFVVAIWNKDVNNFPTRLVSEFHDFDAEGILLPSFTDDEGLPLVNTNGNYDRLVNVDDAGYIRGVELAYTQTFSFLPDIWKGLGVNLNFSYTESEISLESALPNAEEDDVTPLPGLSRRVWTATVFYDYEEIWELRVNARYRSSYLDEQIAIGQSEQAFFEEETVVSAQALYNVSEEISNLRFRRQPDGRTQHFVLWGPCANRNTALFWTYILLRCELQPVSQYREKGDIVSPFLFVLENSLSASYDGTSNVMF